MGLPDRGGRDLLIGEVGSPDGGGGGGGGRNLLMGEDGITL